MASLSLQNSGESRQSHGDTDNLLASWKLMIPPSVETLRAMAGTTEEEFLQIGSQLQDFYLRSSEISSLANRMVETVSGERAQYVTARLDEMIADMGAYLVSERNRSEANYIVLEKIFDLLNQVSQPLEGFQKMYKVLRMLSTSTKIESARIGEKGSGFLTLAMDVEKLSHLVNDKSGNILAHRQVLLDMISENLRMVRSTKSAQDADVNAILTSVSACLEQLGAINERCTRSGELISSISGEVSQNIGEVVASLQAHDMTRQQVEHVVEALERLVSKYGEGWGDAGAQRNLIVETGDVCELQAAQLRHASKELSTAIDAVIQNLLEIARKQSHMAQQTLAGFADSSGHSFIDEISRGLSTVTAVMAKCADADRDMSVTMKKVAETIGQITAFVTDIEDIGSEIDLIALNSQIKAAHTGSEGAALGVLAEAIKRLSVDAVAQTELVSNILNKINQDTADLFGNAQQEADLSSTRISGMEVDLKEILATLGRISDELADQLATLGVKVHGLTEDIGRATGCINVHEKTSRMAEDVLAKLERTVSEAREREPASSTFKMNLLHMQERYTMQSERRIHEAIAARRSGQTTTPGREAGAAKQTESESGGSEFGDNVDFF